jgi:hypothetical protein
VVTSAERDRPFQPRGRPLWLAAGVLGLGVTVSGCVSSEQKSVWAHIQDARIIASQSPLIVRHPSHEVAVTRVALLRTGTRIAIAVGLRNTTSHAINDVPISVGLRAKGGARVYLNRASGLDYFKTHVAEIPAGGATTWVFTAHRARTLAGRPFAVAGNQTLPRITVARSIPSVRVVLASAPAGKDGIPITVTNLSSVPQSEFPVYALALSAGRYTAAGSTTIPALGTGSSTTTRVGLVGRLRGARVALEALPTLFH